MFSSSAEVVYYLEPDVMSSWSVLTALHSVSGFIALVQANAFLNVCFVVLVFLLLCSVVLEAFSACFWHWIKWMWNLCSVKIPVASAVFYYKLRA